MKSSDGNYWVSLDHARAVAALLVVVWHFLHQSDGYPVPFDGAPAVLPLALFDEGHTGVAIFMTLSGYLFAKLLDGKDIIYHRFFWNRFIRLAPLLVVMFVIQGVLDYRAGTGVWAYAEILAKGFVMPIWPNGAWSITAEMHFYLALPLLLFIARIDARWLLGVLLGSIALRAVLFVTTDSVQWLAYWTIVGRLDQFVLGIFLFMKRDALVGQTRSVIYLLAIFFLLVWQFDYAGGFYKLDGTYPSPSAWWIVIPTIEGLFYGLAIACYDRNFSPSGGVFSRILAEYGKFSYSIYIMHYFIVFEIARIINDNVTPIGNFYVAMPFAILTFICMYPIAWISFHAIEKPFLRFRTRYTVAKAPSRVSYQ